MGVELFFGEVSVTEQVIAFQRKSLADHAVIDIVALDLPETNFPTQALWYVLGDELAGPAALPPEVLLGALHATEHGQIAVLPLLAMCDRWDIGGLSTNVHFQTGRPTIFIYDGHPGGVGIARRGFDEFERLVADAAKLIGECPCADGCPSCVQSPKCGNLNEPLHKQGALELMTGMLSRASPNAERRSRGGGVTRSRQIAVVGKGDAGRGAGAAGRGGRPAARRGGRDRGLRRARRRDGGRGARGSRGGRRPSSGCSRRATPATPTRTCTHVVATGIGHARNLAVVASGDAVIAIGGEWGTLSEIAFARRARAAGGGARELAGERRGRDGGRPRDRDRPPAAAVEAVELGLVRWRGRTSG